MTDTVLSAVRDLMRRDGPFVSALAGTCDTAAAITAALETIDGDLQPSTEPGAGAVHELEILLRGRLQEGARRGDVAADLDIDDMAVFYANVAVSLVVEALNGCEPSRLSAIRRVAVGILTPSVAALA